MSENGSFAGRLESSIRSARSARTASVPASFSRRLIRDCAWVALLALALEAVDEALQVGALGLFLLERGLLLVKVLGALALECGVVAGVQLRAALRAGAGCGWRCCRGTRGRG
jgi:hypothetical protein